MKDHRLIVIPGETLRPGQIERGDGEVEHLESMPSEGETFMLIIRGRI